MDIFKGCFNQEFIAALLKYNFSPADVRNHEQEILEQIWYEASEQNLNVVSV